MPVYPKRNGQGIRPPDTIPGPHSTTLLGEFRPFTDDPFAFLLAQRRRYGPISCFRMVGETLLLVDEWDAIRHILVTHGQRYQKGGYVDNMRRVFGEGLVTVPNGPAWKEMRKRTMACLAPHRMAHWLPAIQAAIESLLQDWDGQQTFEVDLEQAMRRVTFSVISRVLFGRELGDSRAIGEAIEAISGSVDNRARFLARDRSALQRDVGAAQKLFDGLLEAGAAGVVAGDGSLLGQLLALPGMADARPRLRAEMGVLSVAGHETSSLGLLWTFHYLARDDTWQERLRAEAGEVLGRGPGTVEQCAALVQTERVLRESMRLMPPIARLETRVAVEDDVLGGHQIPAGSQVIISPWVTHRCEENWPQPEVFRPERFATPRARNWLAFSLGPRACAGKFLAMLEMKAIVAALLRRYRFEPAYAEVEVSRGLALRPATPMRFRLSALT